MARELKLTQPLTGWFDVRVYNERIAKENRLFKSESDNIAFTVTMPKTDPQAVQFVNHGKPYADANGNQRLRVSFKIGPRCTWFDEQAQPLAKPLNSVLDGRQYECVIQYSTLDGDPANPKSPRGYWANAIQLREVQRNPFTVMPGAAPMPPQPAAVPQHPQQPAAVPQQQQYGMSAPMQPMYNENDNLPY